MRVAHGDIDPFTRSSGEKWRRSGALRDQVATMTRDDSEPWPMRERRALRREVEGRIASNDNGIGEIVKSAQDAGKTVMTPRRRRRVAAVVRRRAHARLRESAIRSARE